MITPGLYRLRTLNNPIIVTVLWSSSVPVSSRFGANTNYECRIITCDGLVTNVSLNPRLWTRIL